MIANQGEKALPKKVGGGQCAQQTFSKNQIWEGVKKKSGQKFPKKDEQAKKKSSGENPKKKQKKNGENQWG